MPGRPVAITGDGGTYGETLAGKVAIVTGGGSGIGLATRHPTGGAGASVAVVDIDGSSAEAGCGGLGGLGCRPMWAGRRRGPAIVDAVTARFGGVDLAHLNAGVMTGESRHHRGHRRDLPPDAVGVNVDGVVFGVRALVPAMAAPGGRGHRGHRLPGRAHRLLARPHLLPDQARGGGPGPLARAPAGRAPHHHQRGLPEHRGHPMVDDSRELLGRQRVPAHRSRTRWPRRWWTAWPGRRLGRPW